MPSVILLSPSPHSAYSLAVLDGLSRCGIRVSSVVVKRLVNPTRVLQEFRRDHHRLIRKVMTRLIFRKQNYARDAKDHSGLGGYMAVHEIRYESLARWCARHDVRVIQCKNFNTPELLAEIEMERPDALVFTGGGLIRKRLLEVAPFGVINGHAGILPEYRGMDVSEWAVLRGELDKVGVTIHVMDQGVDTGPVLRRYPVDVAGGDTLGSLRKRIEYVLPGAMVETVVDYLDAMLAPEPQQNDAGRQYFIMHRTMRECAQARLDDSQLD